MMRVLAVDPEPVVRILYLNAGRRSGGYYVDELPVHIGTVNRLPDGVAAILATSDLQGREQFHEAPHQAPPRLLGEALPERLVTEILPRLALPPGRIGVLLAGDFYTVPALDRRGGSGDVRDVWYAFGDAFDWVVGVAGNHDTFGPDAGAVPPFSGKLRFLDNGRVKCDGLQIAGVSGIIGNPKRPWRRSDEQFEECLRSLLSARTDILLMHDGPDVPARGFRGSAMIRAVVEQRGPLLVVRGHAHWAEPLAELPGGVQVLNVDARAVVLRAVS